MKNLYPGRHGLCLVPNKEGEFIMQKKIRSLDIRGLIAPITFLQVNDAFRQIRPGELLEILGDDADTRQDIFQVMNLFDYQTISIEEQETFFRICLKKKKNRQGLK
ncbi:MAG: sulfurtransferase TusA family protein [Desulfobacterales bacterium]